MTITHPDILRDRIAQFNVAGALSRPWEALPTNTLPAEVDPSRALEFVDPVLRAREWVRSHPLEGRLTRATTLWAFPNWDFFRETAVGDDRFREDMSDVMAGMTDKGNGSDRVLYSTTPPYPARFLNASLPPSRGVSFALPQSLDHFSRALEDIRPELVLLSGLNVNTRALLDMALECRAKGVKEVWLGNYASLAPYQILDEVFDRIIAGPGEERLHELLVGDGDFRRRNPDMEGMLANVSWLFREEDGTVVRRDYQTLHLSLHLGCTQTCDYCAEGSWSERGKGGREVKAAINPAVLVRDAIRSIEQAYDRGVRSVYFIDPDFGRPWNKDVHEVVLKHIAKKGMRWSCLTNVPTVQKHGDFMMDHGFASVYLGIESLDPSHQKGRLVVLDRGWQAQSATIQLIERIREKVMVFGLYILGNPGETIESMRVGIERLKECVPLSQISTSQPFPGTEFFAKAVREGRIFDFDPDHMRYGQMVWRPDDQVTYSPQDLTAFYRWAHGEVNALERSFYENQSRIRKNRIQRPSVFA